ncbi:hypothetical protein OIU78_019440 [Salix suchowensis]|nr:hypothetical protein OIU78_019440 [Salix suchowensis]
MTIIDLENNFFIVKFLLDDDLKHVLIRAPWQVAGQYVTTKRLDVLEKISNVIGLTIKVDSHTMSPSRGNLLGYELNISEPLTPCIEMEGPTYRVVYEGIQVICFKCGHYGHERDNFPLNEKAKALASEAAELESMKDVTVPDNRSVEIENLEATCTKQVVGVDVCACTNATKESSLDLHTQ